MVYNCRVCDAMFEDFHYLTVHYRDNHPTERPKAADKENYRIRVSAANTETGTQSNQETLPKENICSGTKIIKRKQKSCNICSDCPGYRSNARRFSDGGKRVRTTKTRISELICKFCGRRFRSIFFKNEHEAQHEKMIYRCPGRCGYMFIHFKKLQWHYKFSHGSNLRRSDKERCKILAKQISENKNSETQDHPYPNSESQKVDRYQAIHNCPFERCRFQYKTFDVLINHAKQNHRLEQERGEQTASFKKRKVSANSAEIVPIPVTQKLVGKRTYLPKCNICQRLFRSAADRNYHEQNHHLMKYKCPDPGCGFMFERFGTLYKHSMRYHNLRLTSKDVQRSKKNHGDQFSSVTKQSRADSARPCDLNIASKAKQMGQAGTRQGSFSKDEYLYNAHSTISSSVSASDVSEVSVTDDDDDHAEFYQAVTHRLCRLDAESRSLAALQVMKILHFAEFNSSFNVPRVHGGFRNAKQSTDKHCVEDITLCKKKIDHVLKRLSAERRQKAKCDILQMLVISFV